jgi:hypothetical protein
VPHLVAIALQVSEDLAELGQFDHRHRRDHIAIVLAEH